MSPTPQIFCELTEQDQELNDDINPQNFQLATQTNRIIEVNILQIISL